VLEFKAMPSWRYAAFWVRLAQLSWFTACDVAGRARPRMTPSEIGSNMRMVCVAVKKT